MAAAKLANMRQGERTNLPPVGGKSVSQQDAADMLNVSDRLAKAAQVIRNHATPDLAEKVEQGAVSVSAASITSAGRFCPLGPVGIANPSSPQNRHP